MSLLLPTLRRPKTIMSSPRLETQRSSSACSSSLRLKKVMFANMLSRSIRSYFTICEQPHCLPRLGESHNALYDLLHAQAGRVEHYRAWGGLQRTVLTGRVALVS